MRKRETVKPNWMSSVVSDYEGPLTRYAARIIGDIERAREVVQDIFLLLCQKDHTRQSPYLARYLFRVCRNRSLDVRKKKNRMAPLEELDSDLCADASTPSQIFEQKEDVNRILQALECLTPNQQEVIRLRYQNDLSYKEISQITGLSVSNVGFLLHTAIENLRRKLEGAPARQQVLRRIK